MLIRNPMESLPISATYNNTQPINDQWYWISLRTFSLLAMHKFNARSLGTFAKNVVCFLGYSVGSSHRTCWIETDTHKMNYQNKHFPPWLLGRFHIRRLTSQWNRVAKTNKSSKYVLESNISQKPRKLKYRRKAAILQLNLIAAIPEHKAI